MTTSINSYEDALGFLSSFHISSLRTTSPREIADEFVRRLRLDDVPAFERIYQITGTNGKGSTAAFLESAYLLRSRAIIVLTSPHCNSIRERIRVNGRPISQEEFIALLRRVAPVLREMAGTQFHPRPTEIIFAMALRVHADMGSGTAGIYEVGCGGRNDYTNIFNRTVVGLTTIAEDHLERFGGDLILLAREKLGLCKPRCHLAYQWQRPEIMSVVTNYCRTNQVTLRPAAVDLSCCSCCGLEGSWQTENLGLAQTMLSVGPDHFLQIDPNHHVHHQCRYEHRTIGNKQIYLDAAHNVPAIRRLLEHIATTSSGGRAAIISISDTKDWATIARLVIQSRLFDRVVCTSSSRGHPVDAKVLAEAVKSEGCAIVSAKHCLRCALAECFEMACDRLFIFGSLLLCADFDRALHQMGMAEHAVPLDQIDPMEKWMRPLC